MWLHTVVKFQPDKLLAKIAPAKKIKKLLKGNISLKRTALSFIDAVDFIDKKNVADTALKVIKGYKQRIKDDPDLEEEILKDPKQLIQRVQNEVILQIGAAIKDKYDGERYIWLPSDADEPRPEHQLNYGVEFTIGDGEQPGDEWGCRCGMQILVDGSSLEL
jgi:hypothetical protein